MPSGIGKPLKLRLFLEGQEVPVISASVSINPNSPSSAAVQVIPLDEGMDLKPRTMVHLFYLDQVPTAQELIAAKEQGMSEDEFKLRYYKLMFSGEVVGFAFAQTPMSRSLVLQCLDFSSYWDACHVTAIEYGPNGNAFYNTSSIYGSNASLIDDIVNFIPEKLVQWLRSKPKTPGLESVSGLAGGIISILEAVGGVPTHSKGVNDFFTVAELRCRILSQITAEEKDKTASNLLSVKVFDQWLRNGLQNMGQQVTFRDLLKHLCGYIYYDFIPNPAAKYEKSISGTTEKTHSSSSIQKSPAIIKARSELDGVYVNLGAEISSNNLSKAITSGVINGNLERLSSAIKSAAIVGAKAKEITSKIEQAKAKLQVAADKTKNAADGSSTAFEAIRKIIDAARELVTVAIKAIDNAEGRVTSEVGVTSTATTARLRTQIFRPDCFFAPAPRCNVIFPEHFSHVSYDRVYLSEVTRSMTMGYMTLIGKSQMFADKVMAPNIGLDMAKIQKQVNTSGYRILMPHERHTGIIPRFEWLPNVAAGNRAAGGGDRKGLRGARLNWINKAALFHFFKYRFGPRAIKISGKFNPYVVCGFPAVIILKPFSPDLARLRDVLKAGPNDDLDSMSRKVLDVVQNNGSDSSPLGAPFQLMGMVGTVAHNLDQRGGTTNITLHHSRRHLGVDDEFVGIFSEKRDNTSRIRTAITTDVAFAQLAAKERDSLIKVLVSATPQNTTGQKGSKIKNQKVTKSTSYTKDVINPKTGKVDTQTLSRTISQNKEVTQTSSADLVDPNGRIDGIDTPVQVPRPTGALVAGSGGILGHKGKVLGIEVVDPTLVVVPDGTFKGKQVYRSIIVHEQISIQATDLVPVEEIIRPTWFSDNYSNAKIGKNIYDPFFGTTSIIDDLQFTGLVANESVSIDDPTGTAYDPATKFQEIQRLETDKRKTKSLLSIERAINIIAYFYGMVRLNGKDVDKFIRDYCERPIANMVDIFGSPDLEIAYGPRGAPTVTKGTAGFHSLALDRLAMEKGNLYGLLADPDLLLQRINNTGKKEPVSPVYDVRGEKLQRVDAYLTALRRGPGLRG